jgi:succinoglycan biosynthesis protein ExoM
MRAVLHMSDANPHIDVCVCTFRRASLRQTLESLAAQQGAPSFRVVVADNDEAPSAQALVEQACSDLGLDITYVHAPARNISIARNACLDVARAHLIAFIDDDEIAPSHWLKSLAGGLGANDVVFGPVKAIYAPDVPRWVADGDFHSFGPVVRANGVIDTGYSSNVLMRRETVGAVRFEPALGRTGGEDTFFFARLHRAGAKLGLCSEAVVEEPTAPERARLFWLLRRAFRSGQTHARVLRDRGQGALAIAAPATAKALYCAIASVLTLWSPVGWRRNAIRGALHVGVIAKAFGARDVEIYGGPPPSLPLSGGGVVQR